MIPDDDTLAVLNSIAQKTKSQEYCYLSDIECKTSLPIKDIVNDLVKRQIIDDKSGYKIQVELFKEWLQFRHL